MLNHIMQLRSINIFCIKGSMKQFLFLILSNVPCSITEKPYLLKLSGYCIWVLRNARKMTTALWQAHPVNRERGSCSGWCKSGYQSLLACSSVALYGKLLKGKTSCTLFVTAFPVARDGGQPIKGDCILRPSLLHVHQVRRTKAEVSVILGRRTAFSQLCRPLRGNTSTTRT